MKVVDFGIAGVCVGTKKDKVDAGSIAYMAPEVIYKKPLNIYRLSNKAVRLLLLLMCGPSASCFMRLSMVISHSGQTPKMSLLNRLSMLL